MTRRRSPKLDPIPVWSAFCEALGTRCTFIDAKGERCDNGVVGRSDRCEEHPQAAAARPRAKKGGPR